MAGRAESESTDSVPASVESEKLSDITRLMLMGEIRTVLHAKPKEAAVDLYPKGFRLAFEHPEYPESILTVFREGSTRPLYHLYAEDPTSSVEFLVSEGDNPVRQVPLNEIGGRWFRQLIADGIKEETGPWRG